MDKSAKTEIRHFLNETNNPQQMKEKMKFTDFNFKDYINQTLENIKFEKPTEVQEKLIPIVLSGRDLVGESKTGSGKTHTFYSQFSKN